MCPSLQEWSIDGEQAGFEKKFFVSCSKVLLADKAGELVMLRHGEDPTPKLKVAVRLCRGWGLSCRVVCKSETCIKVLVYRPKRLDEALQSVPCWVYEQLGYRKPERPEQFLSELARRWRVSMPHAIGLALGYPLKDVLGFTGLLDLECTGQCGWRIYGDPEPSLELHASFAQARKQALEFVAG